MSTDICVAKCGQTVSKPQTCYKLPDGTPPDFKLLQNWENTAIKVTDPTELKNCNAATPVYDSNANLLTSADLTKTCPACPPVYVYGAADQWQ